MRKIDNLTLFSFFGLGLTIFGWLAFFLAVFGIFSRAALIVSALVLALSFFYIVFSNLKNFRFSWDFILVIAISLTTILIFSHYTVPTVFTGRDQGALSSAAISLSQNHNLHSSFPAEREFFKIYGPGQALNFPGYYYTKTGDLVSQFPLGYVSWLGAFYSIFGLGGLIVANAFSFFLFLLSFYLLARNFLEEKPALAALFLIVTSFVFSWFFKFTLGENLALGLIWFGLAQFMLFWKKENIFGLFAFLLSFGLLLFVRIEAIAFLAVAAYMIWRKYKSQKNILKKIFLRPEIMAAISLIVLASVISLFVSFDFYKTILKGFFNSFASFSHDSSEAAPYPLAGLVYLTKVFSAYAILTYIVLALAALWYFLKKKHFEKLIPYFILLPAFIYILHPGISLDHPWMLRRFVFAVVPVSILYSVIFLKDFLKKNRFFYTFSFFLLLTNLMIFSPLLRVEENPTLLPQIKDLSRNFSGNDLVLVDRDATGNPWAMMTGPMRLISGLQAVYFFNPQDLDKIDTDNFDNVYLVVPDSNTALYRTSGILDRVITVKNYSLENTSLNETDLSRSDRYKNPVIIPPYLKNYTYGKIYMLKKS